MGGRWWLRHGLVLSCLVMMTAACVTRVERAGPVRQPATIPTSATAPPTTPTTPGVARIDVAVATLWERPDLARPIDQPSLTKPVDVARWLANMSVTDKQWLVGKLATQALYGEAVVVTETRGAWSKVVVTDQPSSRDDRGYPGWLPTAQLTVHPGRDTGRRAIVIRPSTLLRASASVMAVSYNTQLPVLSTAAAWTVVATPDGGQAVVASSDVELVGQSSPRPSGPELVRAANMFTGLGYLWAGTSGYGFDCSGFTAAVYAAHGIRIPRDANDQATAGVPVANGQWQPGDLLFFASSGGRGFIHHVAMYVGGGLMIQSPATGHSIETVAVGRPGLSGDYWGARRYLP